MKMTRFCLAAAGLLACSLVQAATVEVTMNEVTEAGIGQAIGTISISETPYGLLFTPHITSSSLAAGAHGFHVHEKGSCMPGQKDGQAVAALGAGGHFDPQNTGKHLGPYADGHLGDLPAIYVENGGKVEQPVLAPRLKTVAEVKGRALMIHAGGDNHADHPQPLGGGGGRLVCGLIL